jgi:hypothetical protein
VLIKKNTKWNCSYQHNYKGYECLMLLSTIAYYIMIGAVVAVIVW